MRDPSSILIAFVLPMLLLFLFSTVVSLDYNTINLGIVVESDTDDARQLIRAFKGSTYYNLYIDTDRRAIEKKIMDGELRGMLVIPEDFGQDFKNPEVPTPLQIITDGSETNTAAVLQNYVTATIQNWLTQTQLEEPAPQQFPIIIEYPEKVAPQQVPINIEYRVWFNPDLDSHYFILPGSIAIIMTLIGSLLTALVVAREWERGTMEALMATPVSIIEILAGKLIPYFILGMGTMLLSVIVAIFFVGVPFRGSFRDPLGLFRGVSYLLNADNQSYLYT